MNPILPRWEKSTSVKSDTVWPLSMSGGSMIGGEVSVLAISIITKNGGARPVEAQALFQGIFERIDKFRTPKRHQDEGQ
ncbi:hypothetical protein GCM10007972_25190 [Iodidimonas muriae]|uniref:Uncharacterized protein n=2 Tax=Iodidimonas muriae TaxID=261467 RepID=A0ABQ2LFW2_9PROT|nr:hypothetical protein JCM17843_26290 [Kordiimonadales bacterium JCM 17843]GGO16303.1 hypothetical protein GCM10007972_25190 [Iodidimonas muriae]